MLGFETRREKELRLNLSDVENEIAKKEAEEKGLPYFGWRYEDDNRR